MTTPANSIARRPLLRLATWFALAAATLIPLAVAAANPLQSTRNPAYVIASLTGAAALSILLIQPLLATAALPGLTRPAGRKWHQITGIALTLAVALHVAGLYVTSPDDTTDALLLAAPTPFSLYGVTALWTLAATTLLVSVRKQLPLRPTPWRIAHNALALVVVATTIAHALLIEGTMGPTSKLLLCLGVLAITVIVIVDRRLVKPRRSE